MDYYHQQVYDIQSNCLYILVHIVANPWVLDGDTQRGSGGSSPLLGHLNPVLLGKHCTSYHLIQMANKPHDQNIEIRLIQDLRKKDSLSMEESAASSVKEEKDFPHLEMAAGARVARP